VRYNPRGCDTIGLENKGNVATWGRSVRTTVVPIKHKSRNVPLQMYSDGRGWIPAASIVKSIFLIFLNSLG